MLFSVISFVSQSWECEFCGTVNKVDISPEAVPVDPDTSFVMSPPSHVEEDLTGCKMARDSILVFCVDVSGSMCMTTEVNALYTERKLYKFVSLLQGIF